MAGLPGIEYPPIELARFVEPSTEIALRGSKYPDFRYRFWRENRIVKFSATVQRLRRRPQDGWTCLFEEGGLDTVADKSTLAHCNAMQFRNAAPLVAVNPICGVYDAHSQRNLSPFLVYTVHHLTNPYWRYRAMCSDA